MPGGQFCVRAPHSSTIGLCAPAKLDIQMLSLPSDVPALAAQSVIVELAIGVPAPRTRPSMVPAALAGAAYTTVMNANIKVVTGAETRRSQEHFARFIA